MSRPSAIVVEALVKTFGSFRAVDGLDLSVDRGEVRGFLGPNGAGKSTTIKVLLGLYRAASGRVEVLGRDPGVDPEEVTRQVSYVPGDVTLWPNLTGQEVLDALAGLRGAYDEAAEKRLVEAFSLDPRKKIRTYSKGNRQKVVLIAAFAARTALLVLDEPTSGLDPLMEEVFQQCVRDAAGEGRTVLLSSHILAEVDRLCDSVTIIKDGRLVETGRLSDLRHLGSSQVTARLAPESAAAVLGRIDGIGGVTLDPLAGEGVVRAGVPRDDVARVLTTLAQASATDITCTPATLEDLFLRHYDVAAR